MTDKCSTLPMLLGTIGASLVRLATEPSGSGKYRVYAALGQPTLALQFARASLATCKKNGIGDLIHTASEASARAYAVAKDYDRAREYLDRARRQLRKLSLDREGRKIYSDQIRGTERLIKR